MNPGGLATKNTVREHRERRSLSQQDLASAVGVTKQMISAIETGSKKPNIILALKIAEFFGLHVSDLFALEDTD